MCGGVWVLKGCTLIESLRRASDGEDPDLIYAELYANASHEHAEG